MGKVVQLCYTGAFALGVAGVFLTLYRYMKDRSDGTNYSLSAFAVFTLHAAAILVSYYFSGSGSSAPTPRAVSRVNMVFLAVSVCFVSCMIFFRFRRRFRMRLTRFKRAAYGVLIFLVPQLLFSSSRIGGGNGGGTGAALFGFVALMVAVCTAVMLAVRSTRTESKGKISVLMFFLAGTGVLIAGQLADMYMKLQGFYSTMSYTIIGYAVLAVFTIAAAFHHQFRTSAAAEKALSRVSSTAGISRREREIIDLIVKGYSNRLIAETLFISVSTVKSHNGSIYRKLGISSRMELAAMLAGWPVVRGPEKSALF